MRARSRKQCRTWESESEQAALEATSDPDLTALLEELRKLVSSAHREDPASVAQRASDLLDPFSAATELLTSRE